VSSSAQFLNPSEAAKRLGVSAKPLRLYEQRGRVAPIRTAAGWRACGPEEMARGAEIAALRALGLSLAQVARVLGATPRSWSQRPRSGAVFQCERCTAGIRRPGCWAPINGKCGTEPLSLD
jgi:DNA-binding transcriptional MerR regulator